MSNARMYSLHTFTVKTNIQNTQKYIEIRKKPILLTHIHINAIIESQKYNIKQRPSYYSRPMPYSRPHK